MPRATRRKGYDADRDPWMTVNAAHKALGVSRPTVYQMVARKELRSKTVADIMVVSRADVEKVAKGAA